MSVNSRYCFRSMKVLMSALRAEAAREDFCRCSTPAAPEEASSVPEAKEASPSDMKDMDAEKEEPSTVTSPAVLSATLPTRASSIALRTWLMRSPMGSRSSSTNWLSCPALVSMPPRRTRICLGAFLRPSSSSSSPRTCK